MAEAAVRNEKAGKKKVRNESGTYLAVWALLAKCSIYKVLGVLFVLVPVEILLFCNSLTEEWEGYTEYKTLTAAVESSHISLVFLGALGLVYFVLAWTEVRLDTRSSGVMKRLRLSGSRLFAIKTVYNMACLTVLFAVQIWLCIWLIGEYGRETADVMYASPQRLFLAFYRIDFLHCLMPMAEMGKWVCNLLLLLAFGMAAAGAGETGRMEKKNVIPLLLLYVLTASWFVRSLGRNMPELILDVVYVVIIVVNLWQMRKISKAFDGDDTQENE